MGPVWDMRPIEEALLGRHRRKTAQVPAGCGGGVELWGK